MEKLPLLEYGDVEWRDVVGYEGRYRVSDRGEVFSIVTGRTLRPGTQSRGYLTVGLYDGSVPKKQRSHLVHRIVAQAFFGAPANEKIQVNHKDGNKSNCSVVNLEWVTMEENMQHAFDTGLNHQPKGCDSKNGKLTADQVAEIKRLRAEGKIGRGRGKESKRSIGRRFGVSCKVVCDIYYNKTYVDDGNDYGSTGTTTQCRSSHRGNDCEPWKAECSPEQGQGLEHGSLQEDSVQC